MGLNFRRGVSNGNRDKQGKYGFFGGDGIILKLICGNDYTIP